MFSYCIALSLYSVHARLWMCLADCLAYANTYLVSAVFSWQDSVSLRGADV